MALLVGQEIFEDFLRQKEETNHPASAIGETENSQERSERVRWVIVIQHPHELAKSFTREE